MADEKAKLVLEVQDKASSAIRNVETSWGGLVGAIASGNLVASAASRAFEFLKDGLGQLVDATKVAARIEVLNNVFEMTGKRAGYTSAELEGTKQKLIALGIAEQEALQIGQRFIQAQLDLADATKVARAAQDLAVISGQNSSETALALTDAIVKQRPELLKQYGIIADLNDIYKAQADQLGKNVDQLDANEKRQGFLNTILEQAKTVAGSYETAMEDVGKRLTSLPRYLQQAQNAVGQHFLPIMANAVDAATAFLKAVEAAFSPKTDMLVKAAGQMAEARTSFDQTTTRIIALRQEFDALAKVVEPTADQHARMKTILNELEGAFPGVVLGIESENGALRTNLDLLDDLIEKRDIAQRDKERQQLAEIADQYESVTKQLKKNSEALETARRLTFEFQEGVASGKYDEAKQQLLKVWGGLDAYKTMVTSLPPVIDKLTGEQTRLVQALSSMYPNLEQNQVAAALMNATLYEAVTAYQCEQEALQQSRQAKEDSGQASIDLSALETTLQEGARQRFEEQTRNLGIVKQQIDLQDVAIVRLGNTTTTWGKVTGLTYAQAGVNARGYQNVATGAVAAVTRISIDAANEQREVFDQVYRDMQRIAERAMDNIVDDVIFGRQSLRSVFQGMAADFMKYFIKQALAAIANMFIPGLGSLLGGIFDTPANDRMAMTQGQHFANWFTTGALDRVADFPAQFAGMVAGAGTGSVAAAGAGGSRGAQIIINNPIMDRRFVSESLEPLLVSNSAAGMSDIVIDQNNLTGYDNARII
jgi:hypothetical protein